MIDVILLFYGLYVYFTRYSFKGFLGSPDLTVLLDGTTVHVFVAILAIAYVVLSLWRSRSAHVYHIRLVLLFSILVATVGLSFVNLLYLRQTSAPYLYVHDHALQNELGTKFLLQGRNPYAEDYHDTSLADWVYAGGVNPALYHFISLPSTLYLSLPILLIWEGLFGWYDQRILHAFFLMVAMWSAVGLVQRKELKLAAMVGLGLNGLFTPNFLWGIDDVVVIGLLLLSLRLLVGKRVMLSLSLLAIAVTYKHTAWFILPFYFFFAMRQGFFQKSRQYLLLGFGVIIFSLLLPFLVWDGRAFVEDIYAYPAGTIPTSYPITGFGLAPALVHWGVIPNHISYFPFVYLHIIFLLPLIALLLWFQRSRSELSSVFFHYGVLLWAFWFLSRFFHESYAGFLSVILGLGVLLWLDEDHLKHESRGITI